MEEHWGPGADGGIGSITPVWAATGTRGRPDPGSPDHQGPDVDVEQGRRRQRHPAQLESSQAARPGPQPVMQLVIPVIISVAAREEAE